MKTGTDLLLGYYKTKYQKQEITEEQLLQMVEDKIITEEEKQYIMFQESSVDVDYKEYYEITKKAILEG